MMADCVSMLPPIRARADNRASGLISRFLPRQSAWVSDNDCLAGKQCLASNRLGIVDEGFGSPGHCSGRIGRIDRGRGVLLPIELLLRCIKLFSSAGDTVLDPFVGNRIGAGHDERQGLRGMLEMAILPTVDPRLEWPGGGIVCDNTIESA